MFLLEEVPAKCDITASCFAKRSLGFEGVDVGEDFLLAWLTPDVPSDDSLAVAVGELDELKGMGASGGGGERLITEDLDFFSDDS